MITRPQPQLWIVSTAGTPDRSLYLWGKVDSGRAAVKADAGYGVAYFEWSADMDADPGDPETWRSCMPALGHTITEEAIRAEFLTKDLGEFRRAYLNQWVTTRHDQVIPPEAWESATDGRASASGDIVFAVDVAPDQAAAAIAVCGVSPRDGVPTIEVIDARAGSSWLADRLAVGAGRKGLAGPLLHRERGDGVDDPLLKSAHILGRLDDDALLEGRPPRFHRCEADGHGQDQLDQLQGRRGRVLPLVLR
jgi:hypothetical protein